ncbi:unnamed protein product [Caenorhabditis auriculariae]|uniref:Prospero domain-containing protein n=1 Tax=Caenorhabditis auriculariae TaxID=2777116 RepID=A0A8S1GYU1_9PELO|nr:unnamed protein product [Caenorhabditis auriculariae]
MPHSDRIPFEPWRTPEFNIVIVVGRNILVQLDAQYPLSSFRDPPSGPPMSSGGALPPTFSPFSPFSYLFPQQSSPFSAAAAAAAAAAHQQRLKIKRHRQRVDAGEPRNSFQGKNGKEMMASNESINSLWMANSPSAVCEAKSVEQPTDLSFKGLTPVDDTEQLDVDVVEEKDDLCEDSEEPNSKEETPASRESPSSTSSASKRKSFQPQKIGEQLEANDDEETDSVKNDSVEDETEMIEKLTEEKPASENREYSALQAQLSASPVKFPGDVFEAQKKLYNALLEQQRKFMPPTNDERKIDYNHLVQTLKNEIIENLSSSIERVVREWATAEIARQAQSNNNEFRQPPVQHPLFPANPLTQFPLAHGMNSGIFPSTFNAFNLHAFNALRRTAVINEEDTPKKKKSRTADVMKKEDSNSVRDSSPFSPPASPSMGHTTPNMSRYFPPTLVGHPLYGGVSFGEREDSPTNSDELSDCGPYDGSHSSTLTPMHLRKAKLMFFYTRYPNSNLLKSYFPDIRFNKNNTAQLVKWFSNFREFYYIQMEKFARQLLAEGVKRREDIFVSKDSELFKALNTHYNRNNHIQPPEKLVYVVQESLREFFDAVRMGKDNEPSWKKTIYKVINRLDDVIPEYFKDPNFLDRLDS